MFDVGFWEIALIFGLGLMVLGPERLPRIAAQLGRWVSRARRTASQLRYQLERELEMKDPKKPSYRPPPKSSQIIPPPGPQASSVASSDNPAEEQTVDAVQTPAEGSASSGKSHTESDAST
ncbi:MAG TPA: Sec-independent protein translocase protein TatB [Gammaproteobacteria bacterium]|jgi:sec-independent protein translocase protein TatB